MTWEELVSATAEGRPLGKVTAGSLKEGLEVRLEPEIPIETVKVGQYVALEGKAARFFGMITDVTLESLDPKLPINPPDINDPFIAQVIEGTGTYATLQVMPLLVMGAKGAEPVKSIPGHFAPVRLAAEADMAHIFGQEDAQHFSVGNPLDMETAVCLDARKFVERSNGIFGKSGTGKTFFTRILLACLLQKSGAANLVFDMHDEYGWEGTSETAPGGRVKGLKQLFGARVAVFTLDEESSRRRKVSTDAVVEIGYEELEPEDFQILRQTLNLTENAVQATWGLRRLLGRGWLAQFLDRDAEGIKALKEELGEHEATLASLHRRLQQLRRLHFLVERPQTNAVPRILEYLERGMNVVLEFGRYKETALAYVLVANLLTRRIHEQYVRRTEEALGQDAAKPIPLVITIEEAHRFLNPEIAPQTIFGTIAREMRKYNVTLLVIDQRPSGIDPEVMSQLGTRVLFLLDNEKDVDAALSGVSGARELRAVLARLESREQALLLGHALPTPIVVKVREYGTPDSYRRLGAREEASSKEALEADKRALFG